MAGNRQYDHEYKVQAVKLAKEIGQAKAAKELGVSRNTLYGWVHANRLLAILILSWLTDSTKCHDA